MTNADFKAIWAMVTFYGGKFQSNLDKFCTHLICGTPHGKKYEVALGHKEIKIVTPDWIGESIKLGSKVEEDFFHPRYLLSPKNKDNSPLVGNLSTAQILGWFQNMILNMVSKYKILYYFTVIMWLIGFADDVPSSTSTSEAASSVSSTQALLEKLKQRMPWNRPPTAVSSVQSVTSTTAQMPFQQPSFSVLPQNKAVSPQQQTQLQQPVPGKFLCKFNSSSLISI